MELWTRGRFFLTSLVGSAMAGTRKLFGKTFSLGMAMWGARVPRVREKKI